MTLFRRASHPSEGIEGILGGSEDALVRRMIAPPGYRQSVDRVWHTTPHADGDRIDAVLGVSGTQTHLRPRGEETTPTVDTAVQRLDRARERGDTAAVRIQRLLAPRTALHDNIRAGVSAAPEPIWAMPAEVSEQARICAARDGYNPTIARELPIRFTQAYPLWRGGKVRRSDGRLVQAYVAQRLTPCFMPGCHTLIPPGSVMTLHGRGRRSGSQPRERGPGSNTPVPCCWECAPFELVSSGARTHLAVLIEGGVPVRVRLRGRRYAPR